MTNFPRQIFRTYIELLLRKIEKTGKCREENSVRHVVNAVRQIVEVL